MSLNVPCPHCGTLNRLPREKLGQDPHCGRCKRSLFEGRPLELSGTDFDRIAGRGDLPVLVDFWAPWCGPCRGFAPVFADAARQFEPEVRLVKVDTEAEPELARRFGIRSIPTLAILREGKEIARQSGALGAAQLQHFVRSALA